MTIGAYQGERGRDLARPRRRRRSRRQIAGRLVATAALLASLIGGGYWLLTAPFFAVARVQSGRFRYSSKTAVDAAFARHLGRNIWTLTHDEVAAACADLPWVREVRLQRRIPDTIVVELTEWRPLLGVATAAAPAGPRILVEDGRVLAAPEHLDVPGLPLLVGCGLEPAGHRQWRLADVDVDSLLALVGAVENTGLESACPVDFVRRTEAGFVLELQGRSGSLLLGHGDFVRRLSRYLLTREQIPAGSTVDLRFEDRITFESPRPGRT